MPAAIVHYLFAKRVQEALYKAGQQIPNQDAFLWGAQGTAVLDALQDSRLTVAAGQLAKQSLADLSVQLHDCCSGVESDALRSCAMGFLCSEQLEHAAAPFVAWCAEQMYRRDSSQPKYIWKMKRNPHWTLFCCGTNAACCQQNFHFYRHCPSREPRRLHLQKCMPACWKKRNCRIPRYCAAGQRMNAGACIAE